MFNLSKNRVTGKRDIAMRMENISGTKTLCRKYKRIIISTNAKRLDANS